MIRSAINIRSGYKLPCCKTSGCAVMCSKSKNKDRDQTESVITSTAAPSAVAAYERSCVRKCVWVSFILSDGHMRKLERSECPQGSLQMKRIDVLTQTQLTPGLFINVTGSMESSQFHTRLAVSCQLKHQAHYLPAF
ncbi:uncharacterized [Tachysurus ichikawai]